MIETEHPGCEKWTSNWSLLADIEAEMLEGVLLLARYMCSVYGHRAYISKYIFHICKEIQIKDILCKIFHFIFLKSAFSRFWGNFNI